MFTKKIKMIISYLLLFSMVFSSYTMAAASGEAFVTKEELDGALSDFNRRLTEFEAGINSKIDTQVTSYLDRNGIWSRKPQTVITTTFDFPTPVAMPLNASAYTSVNQKGDMKKIFISTAPGLAFVRSWYYSNKGVADGASAWWGWYIDVSNTKGIYDDNLYVAIEFRESDVDTVENLKSAWVLANIGMTPEENNPSGVWAAMCNLSLPLPLNKVYNNIMFFVDKNKEYYCRFRAMARSGYNSSQGSRGNGGGVIGIDSVDVY